MGRILAKQRISGFLAGLTVLTGVFFGETLKAAGSFSSMQPQALGRAGVHTLWDEHPELTGEGLNVAVVARSFNYTSQGLPVNDYLPDLQHNSLAAAEIESTDGQTAEPGVSPHATNVCSILMGRDGAGYYDGLGEFQYQGLLPDAQTLVYEFEAFWRDVIFAEGDPNADVLSISCGSDQPGKWSRGLDALIDRVGLTVVGSIGNGTDTASPTLYPGACDNVLGVGVMDAVSTDQIETALSTFGLARPEHSSCGPTADQRSKPDLVAPGNCLVAVAGEPNQYEMSGNWSSYAAPVVAGVAGLLVQAGKQDPNTEAILASSSGNCLIKSLLMNSATKLPFWHKGALTVDDDANVPLDYAQGAGMVNAERAYEQLIAGQQDAGVVVSSGWDFNTVSPGETAVRIYQFEVGDPCDQKLTATLNWNRHYSDETENFNRIAELDADLRLELWAVDPNNELEAVLVAVSDSGVDNVEHLYADLVEGYRVYEVQVILNDSDLLSEDFAEAYALTWDVRKPQLEDDILWYDLNTDGIVNSVDRQVLVNYWNASLESSATYAIGDVNSDGVINELDLKVLASKTNMQAEWYQ